MLKILDLQIHEFPKKAFFAPSDGIQASKDASIETPLGNPNPLLKRSIALSTSISPLKNTLKDKLPRKAPLIPLRITLPSNIQKTTKKYFKAR